jgi:cytochrome b subunit of formate dehydrogenase
MMFGHEGGYAVRGVIHRGSAVLMIFGSIWHAIFLLTPRGRGFFRDMIPTVADGKQALQRIMYNVGMTNQMPQFGRFSYVEKAEYWALLWGTVIMVITGFALWFDNAIVKLVPHGFMDVMVVIHYYEAWLAFLAILIWHMYATVFNPDVYPMNPSWITGKMPLHMYKEEHPNVKIEEVEEAAPTMVKVPGEEASGQGKTDY